MKVVGRLLGVVLGVLLSGCYVQACTDPFEKTPEDVCLWVVHTAPSTITHAQAVEQCAAKGGSLISFPTKKKLMEVSAYLDMAHPTQSTHGYMYWTSGSGINGKWTWISGDELSTQSHIWYPSSPVRNTADTRHALLAPMDNVNKRRYLVDQRVGDVSIGFLCEK